MKNTILRATLICGSLDIAYAIVMGSFNGVTAFNILQSVASGPFGSAVQSWGLAGALIGLAVHYTIMLGMVGCFVVMVNRLQFLSSMNPFLLGAIYGTLLYLFMYWVVLALRWPGIFPQTQPIQIIKSLVPHVFLVGIPMVLIVCKPNIINKILK